MQKNFEDKYTTDKNHRKVMDHCHFTGKYRGATYSICNLKYSIPKETPVVFYNGSNYDYHFIMKELAKGFEGEFNCLRENAEKYKTFSDLITKIVRNIDKNGKEITKNISYRLQFIDAARFMASSNRILLIILPENI